MLKRLKHFLLVDLPEIQMNLRLLLSSKKEEATDAVLMRHLLGSLDLSDVKPLDLKEGERKDFAASIAIVSPKLDRIVKQLIEDQKEFALTHDGDMMFSKGTINGFYLFLEEIERWRAEHLENTAPKEKFDRYQTLPELLERVSRSSGLPSNPDTKAD